MKNIYTNPIAKMLFVLLILALIKYGIWDYLWNDIVDQMNS